MDLDGRLAALSKETSQAYDRLIDEDAGSVLDDLSTRITGQISAFAPGTRVTLSWEPRVPTLSPPQVRARIVESGHEADIGRQGHGVQRAYVFSLLRALLDARRTEGPERPGLLLIVEEPEVYQHPLRARYVARVLADLAKDTAQSTQVVYTTHSPYFVSVDNVPAVRLLRLAATGVDEEPPRTRAAAASLDAIAARLEQSSDGTGQAWTAARVAAQLPGLLGTSVSEGLFADAVVLVEGEEDTGLIEGAAEAAATDLAALGIAVISVGGKDPLPLASEVFRALGVPVLRRLRHRREARGPDHGPRRAAPQRDADVARGRHRRRTTSDRRRHHLGSGKADAPRRPRRRSRQGRRSEPPTPRPP